MNLKMISVKKFLHYCYEIIAFFLGAKRDSGVQVCKLTGILPNCKGSGTKL